MAWSHVFNAEVRRAFDFLTPLGFKVTEEKAGVGYAWVHFTDAAGRTVGVVAHVDRLDWGASLSDPARGDYASEGDWPGMPSETGEPWPEFPCGIYEAHSDPAKLRQVVDVMAERFRRGAVPLLTGRWDWSGILAKRAQLAMREDVERLRRYLARDFKDGRWSEVLAHFAKLGADASPLDAKRAAYARKQLGKS
jgi:hypothetical protein